MAKLTISSPSSGETIVTLKTYDSLVDESDVCGFTHSHELWTKYLKPWIEFKFSATLEYAPTGRRKDQTNGYDCGVWVCMYGAFLSLSQECCIQEGDVDKFRAWMVYLMKKSGEDSSTQRLRAEVVAPQDSGSLNPSGDPSRETSAATEGRFQNPETRDLLKQTFTMRRLAKNPKHCPATRMLLRLQFRRIQFLKLVRLQIRRMQ